MRILLLKRSYSLAVFSKVRNGIGNAEEQGNMDALVKPLGFWDSKKGAYQKL